MSLSNSGDNIARPARWQNTPFPQQDISQDDAQKLGAAVFKKAAAASTSPYDMMSSMLSAQASALEITFRSVVHMQTLLFSPFMLASAKDLQFMPEKGDLEDPLDFDKETLEDLWFKGFSEYLEKPGMHEIAHIPSIADIRIISDPEHFQFSLFVGDQTGKGALFQFAYKNDFFSLKRIQDVIDFTQPTDTPSVASFSPDAAARYLSVVGRTVSLKARMNNSPRNRRARFSVLFNSEYNRPKDYSRPLAEDVSYLTSIPATALEPETPDMENVSNKPADTQETNEAQAPTHIEDAPPSHLHLASSQTLRRSPPANPDLSLV